MSKDWLGGDFGTQKCSKVLDNTVEKLFLCVSNCTKLLDLFDMLSHAIVSVVYLGCTGCY